MFLSNADVSADQTLVSGVHPDLGGLPVVRIAFYGVIVLQKMRKLT